MKSWVKLRIEGLNLDRQLDKMIKSGVEVRGVSRPKRKILQFSVLCAQKNNALAFFPHECYNTTVISIGGVGAAFGFVKSRPALIICCAVFLACLFVLNGYVWRVEIRSDDPAAVESALRQNNLWLGCSKGSFSLDGVENMLCNALPDVNYAIVKLEGCTLFVTTYKKDVSQGITDLTKPRDIYASCDGVVTRMTVLSGTARAAVGDAVKKGQLLIEGVRTFADGTNERVCAVGEVYAEVCAQGQYRFEKTVSRLVKTGESETFTSIKFLGFESCVNTKKYPQQLEEVSVERLFPLPVEIIYVKVYKAREIKETRRYEDMRGSCRQLAASAALQKLGGTAFEKVKYTETADGSGVLVTADVSAERRIDTDVK